MVDDNAVIDHGDGVGRTFLDARIATDASGLADILDGLALVLGRTEDLDPGATRNEFKDRVGADAHTGAAACTFVRRNMDQVALNPHGVKGTGTNAITETETGILAGVRAVLHQLGSGATLNAEVVELLGNFSFDLDAAPEGHLRIGIAGSLTRQFSHTSGHIGSACTALVRRHVGIIDDRSCIGLAAGKAATATVCTRQRLGDDLDSGILFNVENLGSDGQDSG